MPFKDLERKRAYDRAAGPAKHARRKATSKKCSKCDQPLWSNGLCNTHYAALRRTGGMSEQVKAVRRAGWLEKAYGLTEATYGAMLAAQGGVCAICASTVPGNKRTRFFHVDHDHATGRVRGLLCSKCNTALGLLDDDVARVNVAAAYLQKNAP